MARKLRVQYEGAVYHVTIRGVERRAIFKDDADRRSFLERLGHAVEESRVRLYLYCLMVNHVHLLAETPCANLSVFMHKLQTAYTVYYNWRHDRAGHLMQGRYGAKPVAGDEYLLKLSRYIHLNPVWVAGLNNASSATRRRILHNYAWSSYRGYAGLTEPLEYMDEGPILELMQGPTGDQRRAYSQFVEKGLVEPDGEFMELLRRAKWGVGGDDFQEGVRALYAEKAMSARRSEDVSFRHAELRVSSAEVIDIVSKEFGIPEAALQERRYGCMARAVAAHMLVQYGGVNQRDAAALLNMGSGSAVCRQLKRLTAQLERDEELSASVAAIKSALEMKIKKLGRAKLSIIKG